MERRQPFRRSSHSPTPSPDSENPPDFSEMSAELPSEIITQILERLPAKSLLRFRSVSRSWNSLITSRPFISQHLSRSIASRDSCSSPFLLVKHLLLDISGRPRDVYTVYRDGHGPLVEDEELEPPISIYNIYRYIGACNGLLCLTDAKNYYPMIVLWNPSIRTCFRVPSPRPSGRGGNIDFFGFGFDFQTSQYKVLRLIYELVGSSENPAALPPKVEVFVLGNDRWRRVDIDVPYMVKRDSAAANIRGCIHWMGCRFTSKEAVIVRFDVHEEMFQEIEIPSSIIYPGAREYMDYLSVAIYGESLCLLEHDPWIDGKQHLGVCIIWVMKRYGLKQSWTKQFILDMGEWGGLYRVLGFRKHGEMLIVNGNDNLVSYESKSQRIKQLRVEGHINSFEAIPLIDSLVLLDGALADGFARQGSSSTLTPPARLVREEIEWHGRAVFPSQLQEEVEIYKNYKAIVAAREAETAAVKAETAALKAEIQARKAELEATKAELERVSLLERVLAKKRKMKIA